MSYFSSKTLFAASMLATAFACNVNASVLPDEETHRYITLKSNETDFELNKQRVPNYRAARKVLTELGQSQVLDSTTPEKGGYGEVYLTGACAVKISYPHDFTATQERDRLFNLKRTVGRNPAAFKEFVLAWPHVIFAPQKDRWYDPDLGADPYNILVYTRVYPVKKMADVVRDLMVNNATGAQADICAFGAALGKMQAATIRQVGDRYYSNGHMDLNRNNIFPTGLPSLKQAPQFTLIDLGDYREGTDWNAPEVIIDVMYHLLKVWDTAHTHAGYVGLPMETRKRNVQSYTLNFFKGLLDAFTPEVRASLKPVYTTMLAKDRFDIYRLYYAGGPGMGESYDWVFPAIEAAFQHHAIPVGLLPALQGFNADAYIRLNPDLAKAAAGMLPNVRKVWALDHYKQNGFNEQRVFLDLPGGFNALTYVDLNADLKTHTAPMKPAQKAAFGQTHYVQSGCKENRIFAALPDGFNPLIYIALHADLVAGTRGQTDAQKFAYGQTHYVLSGLAEMRKFVVLPADFNPLRYIALFPDLTQGAAALTQAQKFAYGQSHYNRHGKVEKRRYK